LDAGILDLVTARPELHCLLQGGECARRELILPRRQD
jgi:hypothetical protein